MTTAIRSSSSLPACFDDSLERLDRAADALAESEREVEQELEHAMVDTVKTAALCLGNVDRMQSIGCIVSVAQHIGTLLDLRQQADQYDTRLRAHQAALDAHLACLASEASETSEPDAPLR
jgi:hypothetical protein